MFGRSTLAPFLILYSFCRPFATTCSPPKPEHSTYWSCVASVLNLGKNFKMWLITFTFKKIIWLIIYIFIIKIVHNLNVYMRLHGLHASYIIKVESWKSGLRRMTIFILRQISTLLLIIKIICHKLNSITNNLYFYNKICLILNVFRRMHVLHAIFFNNLINYLYFYNKNYV